MTQAKSIVLQFADFRKPATPLTPREARRLERNLTPAATETGKNHRLRISRREVWWKAERVTRYWRARLDWHGALDLAQSRGVGDSATFPPTNPDDRGKLCDVWREALAKQLLTPAPDLAAITWKRAQLAGRGFKCVPVSRERAQRAIDDDVAFLAAHPVRQSKREA